MIATQRVDGTKSGCVATGVSTPHALAAAMRMTLLAAVFAGAFADAASALPRGQ
jgi:hypothetical protein